MKRLKIVQASSNNEVFMKLCGFRHNPEHPEPPIGFASHMIPEEGKEFFVYFQKPSTENVKKLFRWDRENWDGHDGFFTLVRVEEGKEVLVDTGYASDSHIHTGINTLTFAGKGLKLHRAWSLHCEIPSPETSSES